MLKKTMIKEVVLNLFFPLECLGCGKEKEWFCRDCFRRLEILPRQACIFCGTENPSGHTCGDCAAIHFLDGVFSAANYGQKEVSTLIRHLKYSLARDLEKPLSDLVVLAIEGWRRENNRDLFPGSCFFLPIPLHPKRERWRGFNQSELIADRTAEKFGWKKLSGLERTINSKPQAKMKAEDRGKNIQDCFRFSGNDLDGKKIILIDDVATSGATLEEAAKTLKNSGAKSVWGLTVARG